MWLTPNKFRYKRTFVSEEMITSKGDAHLVQVGNEFEYTEFGVYTLSGIPYSQKRFVNLKNNQLFILKKTRDVLHVFDNPDKFPLEHTHVCKDDTYTLIITKEETKGFSTLYNVKGPSKDYVIQTVYEKC